MAESWQEDGLSGSGGKGAGNDASTSPPPPFPVALSYGLNPLPQLFTTFPAPAFTYTAPLTYLSTNDKELSHRVESTDSSSEAAATGYPSDLGGDGVWRSSEVERLAQQMHTSAASLLQSGSFHHLLQEQLQKECGGRDTAPPSNTASERPESAAAKVEARVASSLQRLLQQSTLGSSTTLDRPAAGSTSTTATAATDATAGVRGGTGGASLLSAKTTLGSGGLLPASYLVSRTRPGPSALTTSSSSEQWARSSGAGMQLRPRHSTAGSSLSSSLEPDDDLLITLATPPDVMRVTRSPVKVSRPTAAIKRARSEDELSASAAVRAPGAPKEALLRSSLEELAQAQAADTLDNPLTALMTPPAQAAADQPELFPVDTLRRLVQVLPLQSRPFQPFSNADAMQLLSQLVSDAVVQRAATVPVGPTTSTKRSKKEAKTESAVKHEVVDDDTTSHRDKGDPFMAIALQGLCCCVCAAHPTFPAEAAPEGMLDRAITTLSVVMRAVMRALSEAAAEAQEAVDASDDKTTAPAVGGATKTKARKAGAAASGGGASAGSGAHHALITWLEVLRAYVKHLAVVICNRTVRLASDTDLVRLEDICVQAMFVLPQRCEKALYQTYTSYVMDSTAHLFHCVWNRLEVQRAGLAEGFFSAIPLSESLKVRSCSAPTGVRVMPLTIAVLAAAQSSPALLEADSTTSLVRRQQQQCQHWAGLIVQKLLLEHRELPKPEVDVAWSVTVQMAEDLTELLACPEWPVADGLLRALVLGLAHMCLNGSSGSGSGEVSASSAEADAATSAAADWLRPLAVDVVARVALKLYDGAGPFRTVHRVAQAYLPQSASSTATSMMMTGARASAGGGTTARSTHSALEAMAANLVAEAGVDDGFFTEWLRALQTTDDSTTTATPTPTSSRRHASSKSKATREAGGRTHTTPPSPTEEASEQTASVTGVESGPGARPRTPPTQRADLSPIAQLQALTYYAYSRRIDQSRNTRPDTASAWWHARAAQLLSWQHLSQSVTTNTNSTSTRGSGLALPDSALHTLLPAEACPHGGPEVSATQFRWWLLVLNAGLERSMTSRKMGQTLLSLLLSVFQVKDARGNELEVSDTVVRKALVSLSALTALYPPLHRVIWQMARQCVQDSSARVRESVVPLLLTVLTTVLRGSNNSSSSNHGDRLDESSTSGGAAGLLLSDDELNVVADVVSSLLHLLEDRSMTVVSRAIAALETVLTEPTFRPLLASPKGAVLLAFAEFKLLALVSPSAERKHRTEVTRLFLRRWILVLPDGEDAALTPATATTTHAQLAKELVGLTTRCAPEFPHEIAASAAVVGLLGGMVEEVRAQATSARRRTKHTVSEEQLQTVMRSTVRTLWARYQAATNAEEAVSVLATLHGLAHVGPEWLEPLLDALAQTLDYPPAYTTTTSSRSSTAGHSSSPVQTSQSELTGGTLLQVCAIWRTLLSSTHVPTISLERLSRAMTVILSKYVGPYQQRIILAACGALTVMITCGATNKLSDQHIQRPYLLLCYTLMNTYYVRVRALLPTLSREPQNVGYIQRFLFLLSEFVRLYPGWRHASPAVLTDEAVAGSSGSGANTAPNQLVKGDGICQNVYQLAQDVLAACPDQATRGRVAVIVLRVLASVCMLDPSEYLYKCEPQLREALLADADPALQAQGLTLMRDFLAEEDARVELAARLTTRAVSGRARGRGAHANGSHTGLHGDVATTAAAAVVAAALDEQAEDDLEDDVSDSDARPARGGSGRPKDQNSGMATWLLQRFHESVLDLCGSPHAHIRALCLDVLQWTAQGGLLPPVKYLDALVALSADSVAALAQRAQVCLHAHAERHEEAIAAHASQGVLQAYQLHHACRLNLVRSAFHRPDATTTANANGAGMIDVSVHGPLFGLLRKRHRDTFLVSLLRYFYQESKAGAWCRQFGSADPAPGAASDRHAHGPDTCFYTRSFVSLLAHLAIAVVLLPFANEGDVVQVLHQCRTGLDLVGQSALDLVLRTLSTSSHDSGNTKPSEETGSLPKTTESLTLGLWRAVGAVALHEMREALISEYRLTPQKLQRYAQTTTHAAAGHHAPSLPVRRPGSPAVARVIESMSNLVRAVTPCALWVAEGAESTPGEAAVEGLQYLRHALESALLETTAEAITMPGGSSGGALSTSSRRSTTAPASGRGKRSQTAPTKTAAGRGRKRRRHDEDSDDSDDSDDSFADEAEAEEDAVSVNSTEDDTHSNEDEESDE